MERFMQELMVVTIDTRESQTQSTITLPTVNWSFYSNLQEYHRFQHSLLAPRIPARRSRSS